VWVVCFVGATRRPGIAQRSCNHVVWVVFPSCRVNRTMSQLQPLWLQTAVRQLLRLLWAQQSWVLLVPQSQPVVAVAALPACTAAAAVVTGTPALGMQSWARRCRHTARQSIKPSDVCQTGQYLTACFGCAYRSAMHMRTYAKSRRFALPSTHASHSQAINLKAWQVYSTSLCAHPGAGGSTCGRTHMDTVAPPTAAAQRASPCCQWPPTALQHCAARIFPAHQGERH
jgi:hypothetical protein